MIEVKNLDKKISKLTSKQSFIVVIILILSWFSYSFYKTSLNTKMQVENTMVVMNKLDSLNYNLLITNRNIQETNYNIGLMIQGKLNMLDYPHAMDIINKTFMTSRSKIIADVMFTFYKNHIDDPDREVVIRGRLTSNISNYYLTDFNDLGTFYYKGVALNESMKEIEPLDLSKKINDYMFKNAKTMDHTDIMLDVLSIINLEFDSYINKSQKYYLNVK